MAGTLPETTGEASRQPRSTSLLPEHIENAAKTLGQPIVVSAELAAALDGVASLGRHQLRGLATPQELFAPDWPTAPAR
jgi:class 3 adenylate cyclase